MRREGKNERITISYHLDNNNHYKRLGFVSIQYQKWYNEKSKSHHYMKTKTKIFLVPTADHGCCHLLRAIVNFKELLKLMHIFYNQFWNFSISLQELCFTVQSEKWKFIHQFPDCTSHSNCFWTFIQLFLDSCPEIAVLCKNSNDHT